MFFGLSVCFLSMILWRLMPEILMHMMRKESKLREYREVKATDRIYGILPEDQGEKLRELWEEFEEAQTPEAKFAHVMDNVSAGDAE